MPKLTIAIDGPAGSGKSTVARRVAEILGYDYIDTGAMYRAVALAALEAGFEPDDAVRVAPLAQKSQIHLRWSEGRTRVWLDNREISGDIRRPEIAPAASRVATVPAVRSVLVEKQRQLGAAGGVVMEGRDIGSVVLPHADLKIFLTASREVRAQRRLDEHIQREELATYQDVLAEVAQRDHRDSSRKDSPLVAAPDAVIVDSTAMEREEVLRLIVFLVRGKEVRRSAGNSASIGPA